MMCSSKEADSIHRLQVQMGKLENRLWRWQRAVAALCLVGLGLLAGVGFSNADSALTVVEAQEFRVVDSDKKSWAALHLSSEGPILRLSDRQGNSRAGMKVSDKGAFLQFYDSKKHVRIGAVTRDDAAILSLYDNNEKPRVAIAVTAEGPSIQFFDAQGQLTQHLK